MTEQEEAAYMQGQRAVYSKILADAVAHLGHTDVSAAQLIAEREEAIAILHDLCAEFGDNEWEPSLHLADIIDKHLGKYLWERDGSLGALTTEEFEAVMSLRRGV